MISKNEPWIAESLAHGGSVKRELLHRAGGVLDAAAVGTLLGISPDEVDQLRQGRRLLGVPQGQRFAYPRCQFDKTHGVVPGLFEVLGVLLRSAGEEWTALEFLLATFDELQGCTALQVLRCGEDQLRARLIRQARIVAGEGLG